MHVVTLATQKGGSGKSTLCASLAVAAAEAGEGVVAIELDRQQSLAAWDERRRSEPRDVRVIYRAIEADGLTGLLDKIRGHEPTSLVIIDTPGVLDETARIGMAAADLTLLPVRPTIMDAQAVIRTSIELDLTDKAFAFVLTQVPPTSPGRAEHPARAGEVCPPPILVSPSCAWTTRTRFWEGMGVTEYRPRGQAADEICQLWAWVKQELEGQGNG